MGADFSAAATLPEIQFSVHTNYCDIGFCSGKGWPHGWW